MSLTFSEEIEDFKDALEKKRNKLKELKQRRSAHAVQTRKARAALEDLQAVLRGETPPSQRGQRGSSRGISAVPVNEDTGRPARGARREQILAICRKVGASGDVFRTRDVLEELRKVEDEVNDGKRSYTYTLMNRLGEEGHIERKGRGKWVLKS